MKTAIICFSRRGTDLGKKVQQGLRQFGHETELAVKSSHVQKKGVFCVKETLSEWTGRQFCEKEALIFIGACGIAVRAIAPYIKSKDMDPAVVAVDETGAFSVPLLSGHLGGANLLAEQAASVTGAVPVITTATDTNRIFAVDLFAKENDLYMMDLGLAKEVSASLLAGIPVGFYSDFPVTGKMPEGLVQGETTELGICISLRKDCNPFRRTLKLVPKALVTGIGCKKGTKKQSVEQAVEHIIEKEQIELCALGKMASIDLKKDEQGILDFVREKEIPFVTFPAGELMQTEGIFTVSDFVSSVTGADNVCERSAVLAAGEGGRLIQRKQAENGVTAALALMEWRISFEA